MFQKTEKKLSHVDLGKTAKQGITEYSFFGLLDHSILTSPVLSLFSLSTSPLYYALWDISSLLLCLY